MQGLRLVKCCELKDTRPLRMSECNHFNSSLGCFLCSMMLSLDAHKQVFKIFTLIKLII